MLARFEKNDKSVGAAKTASKQKNDGDGISDKKLSNAQNLGNTTQGGSAEQKTSHKSLDDILLRSGSDKSDVAVNGMQESVNVQRQPYTERNGTQTQTSEQTPAQKQKPASLLARIKKVKNFEIYVAVALIIIMVAIYMTTFSSGSSSSSKKTAEQDYAREIEKQLVNTLSQIQGAGRVEAMVTVVGSATIEIAYNIDEKTVTQSGSGGSATSTTTIVKTPVIINGSDGPQPVILFEIKPQVKGVVIVASGAYDVGVRLQLLRAVQTVIADDSVRIEIFTGK